MTAFFANWNRVERLRFESEAWLGTPFVPYAAIRGAGVDCVNLCAELLKGCGFEVPANQAWPRYAIDGGKHNRDSQLTAWLDNNRGFARVWMRGEAAHYTAAVAMPGDVLCFRLGRSAHHAGLLVAGTKFVHAMFGRKVMFATLADLSFSRRIESVYRPLES